MSSSLRHTPERNAARAESFKESLKRGVFVDEFGQENPAVAVGRYKPATKGVLAIPLKEGIAVDIIDSLGAAYSQAFIAAFQKLEKKYNRTVALQVLDNEFVEIMKEYFGTVIDLQVQSLHEWFGETKDEDKNTTA